MTVLGLYVSRRIGPAPQVGAVEVVWLQGVAVGVCRVGEVTDVAVRYDVDTKAEGAMHAAALAVLGMVDEWPVCRLIPVVPVPPCGDPDCEHAPDGGNHPVTP